MIFAQATVVPVDVFDHGIAVAAVAFVGWFLIYVTRRTIGEKGIWTLSNENAMESLAANTLTNAQTSQTLVEIKNIIQHQQENCEKHSDAMEHICASEEAMGEKLGEAIAEAAASRASIEERVVAVHEHTASLVPWGNLNPSEFRSPPVIDALVDFVDTGEELAKKSGCDFSTELRLLRKKIEERKVKMKEE